MPAKTYKEEWIELSDELEKEFRQLTDVERVKESMYLLNRWMTEKLFQPQCASVLAHIKAKQYSLLLDSFYQFMPFGTGGRRGKVGFGPNRINEVTVALSVQGHCNYLLSRKSEGQSLSIVVAADVRIFKDLSGTYSFLEENPLFDLTSRKLTRIAAETYAGNGIRCYFSGPERDQGYLSTPELSFLIRRLAASGGINVSASHNQPDDNGFKFYNAQGSQDIPPHDEDLAEFMDNIQDIVRLPFGQATEEGLIEPIPDYLHREYIESNLRINRSPHIDLSQGAPPIVFTPLCGTGADTLGDLLTEAGHNVIMHEPDSTYDGTFSSIPFRFPNPEVPEAAWPAIKTAERHGAMIIFSTDPDADRLGVIATSSDGKWFHLNGNQIGSILAYYLVLDAKNGPRKKGLIIKTIVTTSMVEAIARMGGCEIIGDLPIGFKFIADVLNSIEERGCYKDLKIGIDDFLFATEESNGYLLNPLVRDKDAAGAGLLLADLVAALDKEGRTVIDYLDEIASECGNYGNGARAVWMTGIKGSDMQKRLLSSLRFSPPKAIGNYRVIQFRDFLYDESGQPIFEPTSSNGKAHNLLLFNIENGWILVRPSGTEPKIKIYSEFKAHEGDSEEAKKQAAEVATMMYRECLAVMGPEYQLSRPAELIPDHIDMDMKKDFDSKFTPKFISMSSRLAVMEKEKLFEWLNAELEGFVEGDPLQALRPAIIELCRSPEVTGDDAIRENLLTIARVLKE